MHKPLIALAAMALATAAGASTPEAWAQMDRRVNRACVAMSGLARPQLINAKISYSDVIGTEIRMIRGFDNRGRAKRLLCAYNRRTGRTEVQDAPMWTAPTMRP